MRICVPLDLASPSTNPETSRKIIEQTKQKVKNGDHVTLLTVIPTHLSSPLEHLSQAIIETLELVSSHHHPQSPDLKSTNALIHENTRHKLSQFCKYLSRSHADGDGDGDGSRMVIDVDYALKDCGKLGTAESIVEFLLREKVEKLILYERQNCKNSKVVENLQNLLLNSGKNNIEIEIIPFFSC